MRGQETVADTPLVPDDVEQTRFIFPHGSTFPLRSKYVCEQVGRAVDGLTQCASCGDTFTSGDGIAFPIHLVFRMQDGTVQGKFQFTLFCTMTCLLRFVGNVDIGHC